MNSYIDSLCLYVSLLERTGREEEAISLITHSYVSKIRTTDLYVNLQLINLYLRASRGGDGKGYFKIAVEMLKKSLHRNPRNVFLANGCGIVLQRTGKQQAALRVFKKVRESVIDLKSCCLNVAGLCLEEGKFEDAVCLYESLLKKEEDPAVMLRLAFALFKAQKFPRAIEVLEKVVARNPDVSTTVGRDP